MNEHHVIRARFDDSLDNEPLYWSNVDGWVSLPTATVFPTKDREVATFAMPLGWMTIGEAIEERLAFERPSDVSDWIAGRKEP